MSSTLDRRSFLVAHSAGAAFLALGGVAASGAGARADQPAPAGAPGAWPGFPRQDPTVVQEFVGASHGNVARVRELLAQHPGLAKSAVDWGFGDWETALGAAAHVGNREIALLLIEHGARLDIFAATMLGMVEAVKAIVAAQPGVERTPGPHGISLLAHAKAGKSEAMIAYVASLPAADASSPPALSEEEMAGYLGDYDAGGGVRLVAARTRFGLALRVDGGSQGPKGLDRTLLRTGEHTFHPVGAAGVRVVFTVSGAGSAASATRVEVSDGPWIVAGTRA